ncbi:unnamed protein product [Mytilus edulis]|uniref:Uncharacterized protein n=1 Tax=Mytilus edulis TaxID=6550 RepID=A0A8S3UVN2_MYTED|nr:unnamed protein product [Mytilus edulis]
MQKFNIYHSLQWLSVPCGFCCCFLGASIPYISGIIHLEIIENFDITDVQAAWAGSLFNSMLMLSCPVGSLLANTFSCRVCIMTGSVVGLIGFVLTSLTENIYIIYVTYGLIAGTSQSLIYTGVLVSVGYYFDKGRSIATGMVVNGCGVAMLALPPIMQQCVSSFGIHGTFRLIGAAFFQCAVFGALMRPNNVEMNRKMENKTKNTKELYDNQCTVILVELVSLSNLASGFGIVMFCGGFGQLAVPLLAEILENDNHDNVPDIDLPKAFAVSGSLYILSAILCALTARKSSSKYSSVTNLSHGDEKKKTNDIELNDDLEMELFIEKR